MAKYVNIGTTESPYLVEEISLEEAELRDSILECNKKLEIKEAKIQALTERNEFLEDLIAELAVQAYSKSPSA